MAMAHSQASPVRLQKRDCGRNLSKKLMSSHTHSHRNGVRQAGQSPSEMPAGRTAMTVVRTVARVPTPQATGLVRVGRWMWIIFILDGTMIIICIFGCGCASDKHEWAAKG